MRGGHTEGTETRPTVLNGFDHRLTPAWLATTCILAGQRPPDFGNPFRYIHLGCGTGTTAAVIAAAHPEADVVAWDPRPDMATVASERCASAALPNLTIVDPDTSPSNVGLMGAGVVILDDVLVNGPDQVLHKTIGAAAATVRMGGFVCVAYKTTVGWTEIAVVAGVLRYVAQHDSAGRLAGMSSAVDVLRELRYGDAKYLTTRPRVASWVDKVLAEGHQHLDVEYLSDDFRPRSFAEVAVLMERLDGQFVSSTRLTDELNLGVPPALTVTIAMAPTTALRELYRDLACCTPYRVDLFQVRDGATNDSEPPPTLADIRLRARPSDHPPNSIPPSVWEALRASSLRASELDPDADQAGLLTRTLLENGVLEPLIEGSVPVDNGLLQRVGVEPPWP